MRPGTKKYLKSVVGTTTMCLVFAGIIHFFASMTIGVMYTTGLPAWNNLIVIMAMCMLTAMEVVCLWAPFVYAKRNLGLLRQYQDKYIPD